MCPLQRVRAVYGFATPASWAKHSRVLTVGFFGNRKQLLRKSNAARAFLARLSALQEHLNE